ncbi:hypothetical protein [Nannocystis punicea]|uniref:Secreted protein n=1 Tax=Nannocystis punicea TaxID=2995304 RepID=A0ABY7H8Z3_9BACT|nr:hypothetical protein [Nannocystis poenicansa]WAS95742.1 hypothetical protein O0S08_06230 [Nannocystis poenicansa]
MSSSVALPSPRTISRCALVLGALCLSACVEDEFEDLDELVLAEDDEEIDEELVEDAPPASALVGPEDLQISEDPSLYCIPQTWSTCGSQHAYNCCPPDAPFGATCYWRSCHQYILDENCVVHSTGYTDYSGCATG